MLQTIIPLIPAVINAFVNRKKQVADESGVESDVVDRILNALSTMLPDVQQEIASEVEKARQHDVQTFCKDDHFANLLRSSVRPVVTFTAVGWYIYARVHNISLSSEDYAIIGGVLAFWFGFRPFEKRGRGN